MCSKTVSSQSLESVQHVCCEDEEGGLVFILLRLLVNLFLHIENKERASVFISREFLNDEEASW